MKLGSKITQITSKPKIKKASPLCFGQRSQLVLQGYINLNIRETSTYFVGNADF